MALGGLDVPLLVVEPSAKSIDVARPAAAIIAERRFGLFLFVANRIRDAEDEQLIGSSLTGVEIVTVPDDDLVNRADSEGRSPMDLGPDSPAVQAIARVASRLLVWAERSSASELLPLVG